MTPNQALAELVKNLDYSLRISGAKKILIASDRKSEGKTTFSSFCLKPFSELYEKKLLFIPGIEGEEVEGIDNLSREDYQLLNEYDGIKREAFINELSKNYDYIFFDSVTLKRFEKTKLPPFSYDGAILIRSKKSLGKKLNPLSDDLLDREIPILGIVYNEALS